VKVSFCVKDYPLSKDHLDTTITSKLGLISLTTFRGLLNI